MRQASFSQRWPRAFCVCASLALAVGALAALATRAPLLIRRGTSDAHVSCAACSAVASVVHAFHTDPAPAYLARRVEEDGREVPYARSRAYSRDVLTAVCEHRALGAHRRVERWWGATHFVEDPTPWYAGSQPKADAALLEACEAVLPQEDDEKERVGGLIEEAGGAAVEGAARRVLCKRACGAVDAEPAGLTAALLLLGPEGVLVLLPAVLMAGLLPALVWRAAASAALEARLKNQDRNQEEQQPDEQAAAEAEDEVVGCTGAKGGGSRPS